MNMPLWFSNLTFWSAQVALLVLAAGFLPRLFQIHQPRVLIVYWRALLAIALVVTFLQPWHRAQSIAAFEIGTDTAGAGVIPASSHALARWHLPSLPVIAQIVGVVILAGIAARLAILVLGLLRLRQFRQASSPISALAESAVVLEDMRLLIDARAEFRISSDVDSPVTFGFAAPVILLPERFPLMDARFQAAIACHELLHVRRRDWLHHLSEEILRAAFWFHPAIAWLIARIRLTREQVVDLEVIKLTKARKTYMEALLEFTARRPLAAAIPAPPFLVERQLIERVALMLKEVRMSRTRLIASLAVISCCVALAVTLAARTFPLKGEPLLSQAAPTSGVTGGISGGVEGGVGGELAKQQHVDEPNVDRSTIWIDTVKRGPMVRQVRGLGTLIHADSGNLAARITLPEFMVKDMHPNQNAAIASKDDPWTKGHVHSVSREVVNGTVAVDITFDAVPGWASEGREIDATIDIEKLDNILYVGRPVHVTANSTASLFKMPRDGNEAERVTAKFGRSSVNAIEVLDGLKEGDKIILSDMSSWDNFNRIQIK